MVQSSILSPVSELAIRLPIRPDQTGFNLRRWEELCRDPFLATLEQRIETDRHGNIIMTPPAGRPHGSKQSKIDRLLGKLIPEGEIVTECPISTSDGVRAADVAWLSQERSEQTAGESCLSVAPEICVEVLSPSNTDEEMADKKALYFAAGAGEVWYCREDGTMEFYLSADTPAERASKLCPEFPATIE